MERLIAKKKVEETFFFFGRQVFISLFLIRAVIAHGYGKFHREFVSKSSPIMHLAKSEVNLKIAINGKKKLSDRAIPVEKNTTDCFP